MAIKHTKTAVPDVDKVDCTDWNADHTAEEDPIFTAWDKDHADLTNVTSDQHHNEAHTLASHSTKAHTELTNVTSDQHHAQSHNAASHSDITSTGAQIDDAVSKKHDRQHALNSAADHTGAITDAQHGVRTTANAHAHSHLSGVTSDLHHAQSHNIASHSDTTATGAELEELTDGSETTLHSHAAAAFPSYDTGWINRSDWTDVNPGSNVGLNVNSPVVHNLNAPLSELIVRMFVSTDGEDWNSFEIGPAPNVTDTKVYGIFINELSVNAVNIQTGIDGLVYIVGNGTAFIIAAQNYYYKIKVWKLG
ncbi:hypothetical protein ES703_66663 [subsurface metagenome]